MSFLKHMCSWCICSQLLFAGLAFAQVPAPASVLGHTPGDDFYLATYEESVKYFHTLAASSGRMKMFTVGKTTEGRDIEVGVISSPENLARLDEYKKAAGRLATATDLTDDQAHQLARDSKVIVHIDGGLHSAEVAGGQHSIALAYKLLSAKNDPEIDAILNNVILVLWPTLNPDGQDMIVNWYRKNLGTKYEVSPLPWLYQDYVGYERRAGRREDRTGVQPGYLLLPAPDRPLTRTYLDSTLLGSNLQQHQPLCAQLA